MPNNYELPENEYYPTPHWCVDELLKIVDLSKVSTTGEPCRGQARRIYDKLKKGSEWFELSEGKDYLKGEWENNPQCIITNPPFSLAKEFLSKSLEEADVVIYLLRLAFLETKGRMEFNKANPPDHLVVLSSRPSFSEDGHTDPTAYAWFIYDKKGILELDKSFYFISDPTPKTKKRKR